MMHGLGKEVPVQWNSLLIYISNIYVERRDTDTYLTDTL